jgi:N-acetylmuramoyl-L-alanine amidase
MDVAPQIINDSTLLPVRAISEALGADVSWNQAAKTATIKNGGKTLTLTIGTELPGNMGAPALISGRILVLVRYTAENLGANVVWDEANKTAYIYQ